MPFVTPAALPLRRPTRTHLSPRRPSVPPRALLGPAADFYRDAEGLDDTEADMTVWNTVIHASLKRKLDGLTADTPVQSGVSALIHAAPGYASTATPADGPDPPLLPPPDVVTHLLDAFVDDALLGATAFIAMASHTNHVKRATPQSLVLFVGDNESYRILLRLTTFTVHKPRFEKSRQKCVVRADVHAAHDEIAAFDFQLSSYDGRWLVDECFRL